MKYIERSEKILKILSGVKYLSYNQLQKKIGHSESTIRRDIYKLATKGQVIVSHGSISIGNLSSNKYLYENTDNLIQKQKISKKAASLITENDSIIINGGSTCYYMSEYINKANVSIFTNSFILANRFVEKSSVNVSIGGGTIITNDQLIYSPHKENIIEHLYASKYFLGAKSITTIGLLESDPLIINYDNLLMKRAQKTIVLADSSKFRFKKGCYSSIGLENINTIITDAGVKDEDIKILEEFKVKIIIV